MRNRPRTLRHFGPAILLSSMRLFTNSGLLIASLALGFLYAWHSIPALAGAIPELFIFQNEVLFVGAFVMLLVLLVSRRGRDD